MIPGLKGYAHHVCMKCEATLVSYGNLNKGSRGERDGDSIKGENAAGTVTWGIPHGRFLGMVRECKLRVISADCCRRSFP